jgi:hypothetical protein
MANIKELGGHEALLPEHRNSVQESLDIFVKEKQDAKKRKKKRRGKRKEGEKREKVVARSKAGPILGFLSDP